MSARARAIAAAILLGAIATPSRPQALSSADANPALDTAPSPSSAASLARPSSARRLVRVFDFEEPTLRSRDVPRNWIRAQSAPGVRSRPGFPLWNEAYLDNTHTHRGIGAVRLPADGRSVSLRLLPGVLPVFPGADYLISARVRTTELRHARARLVARFLNAEGVPIPGAEVATEPIASAHAWREVRLQIFGDHPYAADLQIDLELVQPRLFDEPRLGQHHIWREDLDAAAWFDDVAVFQLPRIDFHTNSPANILHASETPAIELAVRDLTGERLHATITLTDDTGAIIDTWSEPLGRGRVRKRWTPDLPRLGWYRADLTIHNDQGPVGAATLDFARVLDPPDAHTDAPSDPGRTASRAFAPPPDRQRFMLVLDDPAHYLLDAIPDVVERTSVGAVSLPVWNAGHTPAHAQLAAERLGEVAETLTRRGIEIELALPTLPDLLRRELALEAHEVLPALSADRALWGEHLDPYLDRFGQLAARWRLGRAGEHEAPAPRAALDRLADDLAAARNAIGRLVPGPRIHLAWPAERALPDAVADPDLAGLDLRLPQGVDPLALQHLATTIAETPAGPDPQSGPAIDLVYTPEDLALIAPRDAAVHFAFTTLHAWRHFAHTGEPERRRLAIDAPWTEQAGRRPVLMPRPEIPALRNLAERLAGRAFVAELQPEPGLHLWLFAPRAAVADGRGALAVAWTSHHQHDDPALAMRLASIPVTVYDLYGNAARIAPQDTPLPVGQPIQAHTIPLSREPVFIEDVDPALVLLAAGARVEPNFFTVENRAHNARLIITNPYDTPLIGRWNILSPGGREPGKPGRARAWDITPRAGALTIPPGGEFAVPLRIAFSLLEPARELPFIIEIDAAAEDAAARVRAVAPVEIGLPGVELTLAYRPAPNPDGPNLVVDAIVSNFSSEPIALQGAAYAPGAPRQTTVIPTLPPGRQIHRRFVFRNAFPNAEGARVVVSFTTADGARLNGAIDID